MAPMIAFLLRSATRRRNDYFIAMGWLQQTMAPVPPLVTMNSDLQLAQIYLLPVSLATRLLPNPESNNRYRLTAIFCNRTKGNCHYRQRSKGIQLGWPCPLGFIIISCWQLFTAESAEKNRDSSALSAVNQAAGVED